MRKALVLPLLFLCFALYAEGPEAAKRMDSVLRIDLGPTLIMGLMGHGPGASVEYSRRIGANLFSETMVMGIYYANSGIWAVGTGLEYFPNGKEKPEGLVLSGLIGVGGVYGGGLLVALRGDVGYQKIYKSGFTTLFSAGVVLSLSMLPIVPVVKICLGRSYYTD
jgi:hypothetical protein